MLMFAELMSGQMNLLHKYTYTKEQREKFRDLRRVTHQGVGIQQVSVTQGFMLLILTLPDKTPSKPSRRRKQDSSM